MAENEVAVGWDKQGQNGPFISWVFHERVEPDDRLLAFPQESSGNGPTWSMVRPAERPPGRGQQQRQQQARPQQQPQQGRGAYQPRAGGGGRPTGRQPFNYTGGNRRHHDPPAGEEEIGDVPF